MVVMCVLWPVLFLFLAQEGYMIRASEKIVVAVFYCNCLVGLVVKMSASGVEDPRFESHLRRDFSGVESYQ